MAEYGELSRLLDFMEKTIDLDHIGEIERLQYNAIKYRDIERLPLTVRTQHDGYTSVPYQQAFNDPEKMLFNELLCSAMHSSYNSVRLKDDGPLTVRSNHGAGIVASLFGCGTCVEIGRKPRVVPISVDEAKKRFEKGVPKLDQALGERVIDTYAHYHQRLKPYPKCRQGIHITQPDLKGPYDTLHLILGNEAFILPFHDPEAAKRMVDIIAETCIAFRRFIDPYLTDNIDGDAVFVDGLCAGGKILIKADAGAANLSPECYQLYEGEPDRKIMRAFADAGGGAFHYSGGPKEWHHGKMINELVRCIHFGNPELHDFSAEYAYFKEKGLAIVGWGYDRDYQFIKRTVLDAEIPVKTGVTLMCEAKSIKQGAEILKRHNEFFAAKQTAR